MATKTFEELKQLAIQIRDEKTNKQNTATRIGTQMLEHLDKLEQDYYDKTATDEKFTEIEEKIEGIGEVDLSGLENKTSSIGYVTCDTAAGTATKIVTVTGLTALSTGVRLLVKMTNNNTASNATLNINSLGAKPLYYNNERASTDNSWEPGEVIDVYFDGSNFYSDNFQGGSGDGGNLILEWNTDAATTRKQVKQSDRKSLLQISYKDADGNPINEQYIGTTFTDTEWVKDSNWKEIANYSDIEKDFVKKRIGNNLYDQESGQIGVSFRSDGTITNSSSNYKTIIIPIIDNTDGISIYPNDATANIYNGLLNSEMKAIPESITQKGNINYVDGAKYAVFSLKDFATKKYMVNYGMEQLPYEDYSPIAGYIKNDKNLPYEEDISSMVNIDGYYLGTGNIAVTTNYLCSQLVEVYPGDSVSCSSSLICTSSSTMCHLMFDKNEELLGRLITDTSTPNTYNITQDMYDKGCRYVAFSYRPDDEKKLIISKVISSSRIYSNLNVLNTQVEGLVKANSSLAVGNIKGIATMGASLIAPPNTWIEQGCVIANTKSYNKAVGGVGSPGYFANEIYKNTYCTDEEFDNMDILVIQFASSGDVYLEENKTTIEEYEARVSESELEDPFSAGLLSVKECVDYILKKWQKRCYEQKDKESSPWYKTKSGKPFRVLFVTHWHDARVEYNTSVRLLAEKWGGGVCEFDKKIGFSKNQTLPDGTQISTLYARDNEVIESVTYGWHPAQGDDEYIQNRMANLFAFALKEYFGAIVAN